MLDQRGQGAVGGGRCREDASFLAERAAARGWPGIPSAAAGSDRGSVRRAEPPVPFGRE